MKIKTVNREIIEQLATIKTNKLGEGTYGTVYKYDKETAIKLFYKISKPSEIDEEGIKEVLTFENLNIEGLSFFTRTMYMLSDKQGIYGQAMPFINGVTIEKIPKLAPLQMIDINEASKKLEREVLIASDRKLIIQDFSISNVLYSKSRKICFIDCAGTEYDPSLSLKTIKRKNMIDLNETFTHFIKRAYEKSHYFVAKNEPRLIEAMEKGNTGISEYSSKILTLQLKNLF